MRALFCGVRGSVPAPGAAFARAGGNTSCVAVTRDGEKDPSLVLDAGTGLRVLAEHLGDRPFRGTILLSHLHWDHVHGLPFFTSGDRDDASVALVMPAQGDGSVPIEVLRRAMSPPHFPIGPEGMRGNWRFAQIETGASTIEGLEVVAAEVPHKGGRTFGYRVNDGRSSVAYVPDHAPTALGPGPDGFGVVHDAAMTLARDVDVLVHDAQFTRHELETATRFGHATIDYALRLAEEAGAKQLVLFHHAPTRTDADLDALRERHADAPFPVVIAKEGLELTLSTHAAERA
jgi:phosphoribosyl 1,2-cyclic phosphodiesterase